MQGMRSMRRFARTSLIGWLVVSLQLVAGTSTTGNVLCVGADGHIVLELAHTGDCAQETTRHHGPHTEAAALTAACHEHPCADIALGQPASRTIPSGQD